jgi:hypothetical protein
LPPAVLANHQVEPEVESVMQVDISKYRTNHPALSK